MKDFMRHYKQLTVERKRNPMSQNAFTLYHLLLEHDNELGWMDYFTAPNGMLASTLQGFSLKSLERARNELIAKGYIKYKKGLGNQAGRYLIVDFGVQNGVQNGVQSVVQIGVQTGVQVANKVSTLTKPNENQTNISPPDPLTGDAPAAQRETRKRFVPPSVEEVASYCHERNNGISAEAFVAHYASKGWMIGKSPMKNWKQAVITWEQKRKEQGIPVRIPPPPAPHILGAEIRKVDDGCG